MSNYRKIYEQHHGLIPKDSDGRRYEIHHIDGNHTNDSPENLKAITIQEHYDIHYSQGDWGSCQAIALRMGKSPEEIGQLSSKAQRQLVVDGTHHLLGGKIQRETNQKRVANGTHHFLGGEIVGRISRKRVSEGTHHLLGPKNNLKHIADGTHPLLGENNPNRIKVTCPYCHKVGGKTNMHRWHFENCKMKIRIS